jgi:hypothetical protein
LRHVLQDQRRIALNVVDILHLNDIGELDAATLQLDELHGSVVDRPHRNGVEKRRAASVAVMPLGVDLAQPR